MGSTETKPDPLGSLAPGDLVISRVPESASHYAVRQHPGSAEFTASPRDEAIRLARGFARAYGVDVWVSEEDGTSRIEQCRVARVENDSETRHLRTGVRRR